MAKKKLPTRGRPRKLKDGHIAINVKLSPSSWAALRAQAETETRRRIDGHVTSLSDVARLAIDEWLLAVAVGQRPSTTNGVARQGVGT